MRQNWTFCNRRIRKFFKKKFFSFFKKSTLNWTFRSQTTIFRENLVVLDNENRLFHVIVKVLKEIYNNSKELRKKFEGIRLAKIVKFVKIAPDFRRFRRNSLKVSSGCRFGQLSVAHCMLYSCRACATTGSRSDFATI